MRNLVLFLVLIFPLFGSAKNYPSYREDYPELLIVDMDASLNNLMALGFLVKSPEVHIKAVTTMGNGMTNLKQGARHILNLLELAKEPQIPVAYGHSRSLKKGESYPSSWVEDSDQAYQITLPHNPHQASRIQAVDLMEEIIKKNPKKISFLALGPLTNIATFIDKYPVLHDRIRMIYIQGGAVYVPGNLQESANRAAEYHMAIDPEAASIVFESKLPITLIPLEVTRQVTITQELILELDEVRATPLADFVYSALHRSEQKTLPGPVAAALVTNPSLGHETYQPVELDEKKAQTKRGGEGCPIRIYQYIDVKPFYKLFIKRINLKGPK